ncbi:MAG: peptidoglycan DD-metalloendopeptidase family protein [Melioribacteraceae bacterium]|nr:peptidoglycan DD-metalloendopeptidase family protein [Melioribacteraceae bacterium]
MNKILLMLFFVVNVFFAQNTDEITENKKELDELRTQITNLQKTLDNKTSSEKKSYLALENINQQNLLLKRLVRKIKREEQNKINEIGRLETEITGYENGIKKLREEYSKYVIWQYKYGKKGELEFLLDSDSFNQAMNRLKYFSSITEANKTKLVNLKESVYTLKELKAKYKSEKKEQSILLSEKEKEQRNIEIKRSEKQNLLKELKESKEDLNEEINQKRLAEVAINELITKLEEDERKRLSAIQTEKLKTGKSPSVITFNYNKLSDFTKLKGKLSWPVEGGTVKRKFGEIENKKLKTKTWNYGIDIEAGKSSDVTAVAEGYVSAIKWIPGYGSVLILTHKNSFRTVYGHLDDIIVGEGDKVDFGTKLGTVNESIEGSLLHFEIWNSRNYQNPELWLVKK